ncbi:replication-relaxation family protein [Amycolatopsis sp. Poz14]|uniref:replication-relaxation family protein n=1 Tax=Amycolatopsis sp. Poz14 TaxID=1447705 RepID=UPI001EE91CAD|nr:replication-relaxation family protein [Amycolatopsis sp. Poz14]MCG3755848.1 replication-relaxation family protein [Amycolatopsis sp. Poz14]
MSDNKNDANCATVNTGRVRRHRPRGKVSDPVELASRLTERDRDLLHLLSEHRVLTSAQVADLLPYPSLNRAQRRLLRLWHWHVLDRFRHPRGDGALTGWRYALGTAGHGVLAAMRGQTPPRPNTVREQVLRLATDPRLAHLLGINDVLAALTAHARRSDDAELRLWHGERSAAADCGGLARPDALIVYREHGNQLVGCYEHDTGSEPLTRVTQKLDGYAELARAGGPRPARKTQQRHGFWVLFGLPSPIREANLRDRLTAADPTGPGLTAGDVGWHIATTHADALHDPAGPVWLPLRGNQRQRLADLAASQAPVR